MAKKATEKKTTKVDKAYTAASIKSLEIREQVRKRPGMWIGNSSNQGLHHLIHEIVDNSVDEYMAGHGDKVLVDVKENGWVTVRDFGRGIPVDTHESGKSALELVLTQVGGGGKYGGEDSGYMVSGGLHGAGSSVVNFVSSEMKATIYRDGFEWHQSYKEGIPDGPVKKGKKSKQHGTEISWKFDEEVFDEGTHYDRSTVERKLREVSYLSPGMTIELVFHGEKPVQFYSEHGLSDFMQALVKDRENVNPVHKEPITFSGSISDEEAPENDPNRITFIDVSMFWTDTQNESEHIYTNSIHNPEGGTHYDGFRRGLRKALNDAAKDLNKLKAKEVPFEQSDTREGLFFAVAVKVPEPQFEGQTKMKLNNPEVEKRVADFVAQEFYEWLTTKKNKAQADLIFNRVKEARDGRLAARKAKQALSERKGLLGGGKGLPSKVADCRIHNRELTELFIVEGDSAGGGMVSARNRDTQAIMPLRGKINNAERYGDKVLDKGMIKDMLSAIGGEVISVRVPVEQKNGKTGYKTKRIVDASAPRYGAVILTTDADVDGGHIATLILTFFYRFIPDLIRDGRVYIAKLPLYRVEHKKKGRLYLYTDKELEKLVKEKALKTNSDGAPITMRFKGLGEMNNEQLFETALNPETRKLIRVKIEDLDEAEDITTLLMGSRAAPRRAYIEDNAENVEADI